MSTFKNKNSLRTIEAQIVQKLKNNEARSKFTGSYKKSVYVSSKAAKRVGMLGRIHKHLRVMQQTPSKRRISCQ